MKIEVLKDQIVLAKEKTEKLVSEIPKNLWMETPAVLNTNLNWQLGHIILANYLHGIASIKGPSAEFRDQVNVPDFIKFCGPNSVPSEHESEKPTQHNLMEIYELTFSLILKGLENLTDQDLENPPEVPNPAVKSKYAALLWVSQHHSWHNGQIAVLKRVLHSE